MSTSYAWADHRIFEPDAAPGGKALLFGADHASLFALDAGTRDVLARWRAHDAIVLRDVPPADREVLEALRDARVLIPTQLRQGVPPAPIDPAEVPLATLVLEVAQTCNLSCSYCYAGGGAYGGAPRRMRPELARRAARHLVDASGDRPQVTLVLFGGEPLLNLAAVEAAVTEAEAAAREAGKRLVVSLTTNGTRFTPRVLDFLSAHRIGVSVSIDGPPDVHDANRRYARRNGGGTYADVVAGLKLLRAHGCRPPAARVTLTPEQWTRVPDVFEHLLELGFLEVGIAPASPVDASLLPTPAQDEALFAGFALLAERFVREAAHGRVLPFSNLLDLLARLHLGQVKSAPCGAGLGYLALDADGRFFLCHRFAGAERFGVGDLESGVDHAGIGACLAAQAAPREKACGACWARSLCAGGCHYENHLREVRLGLPPGGSCAFIRRWLELGIRVYAGLGHDRDNPVLAFLARRAEG
jgi:uncharacterized protein